MDMLTLYLWTRLDAIEMLAVTAIIVGGMFGAVATAIYLVEFDGTADHPVKRIATQARTTLRTARTLWIVCFLGVLVAVFVPNKTDVALMYGIHWTTNNENAQEIPNDILKLIREWINEARPEQDSTEVNP